MVTHVPCIPLSCLCAEFGRTFCLRAYELARTDKHLYIVWPRVMAALGEKDNARVLYERGLDFHPSNTKVGGK